MLAGGGSMLIIIVNDTLAIPVMAGTILALIILPYRKLMYITFHEEHVKINDLSISKLN
jgi:ABC-type Mn2+/Zn2+ transport system permease subunit